MRPRKSRAVNRVLVAAALVALLSAGTVTATDHPEPTHSHVSVQGGQE